MMDFSVGMLHGPYIYYCKKIIPKLPPFVYSNEIERLTPAFLSLEYISMCHYYCKNCCLIQFCIIRFWTFEKSS